MVLRAGLDPELGHPEEAEGDAVELEVGHAGVQGAGCRVQGAGCRVQGVGCRV